MNQLHVFWPIGCNPCVGDSVLGWRQENTVVVVGTKGFSDEQGAQVALDRLWQQAEEGGGNAASTISLRSLKVLGHFKAFEDNAPIVDWTPEITSRIVIFVNFEEPSSAHYRLYSIEGIDLDLLLSIPNNSTATSNDRNLPLHAFLNGGSSINISRPADTAVRRTALSSLTISQLNNTKDTMDALHRFLGNPLLHSKRESLVRRKFWKVAAEVLPGVLSPLISSLRKSLRPPFSHFTSTLSRQTDLRLEQIGFVLESMSVIRQKPELVDPTQRGTHYASYISAQNAIWLILNDIILGISAGLFLRDNKVFIGDAIFDVVDKYTIKGIRSLLLWLDNWPAGLKLNTELSAFSFATLSAMLDVWEDFLNLARPVLPFIVMIIGMLGIAGLSMILASLSDLLSCLTIHLDVAYVAIRVAFRNQLIFAQSLFNLFRGKRYNGLRSRLDDWNFDLDQLLLGTMLFTLISFLFPTILVYYFLFASARFSILMLKATFQVALALVNHFPLFALTLRLKDSSRLPGGIVIIPDYRMATKGRTSLMLRSTPKGFKHIFSQYFVLGTRLALHYSPSRLIPRVLRGESLDPIPSQSIRYNYGRRTSQAKLSGERNGHLRY